jgi:hypothetical protein
LPWLLNDRRPGVNEHAEVCISIDGFDRLQGVMQMPIGLSCSATGSQP